MRRDCETTTNLLRRMVRRRINVSSRVHYVDNNYRESVRGIKKRFDFLFPGAVHFASDLVRCSCSPGEEYYETTRHCSSSRIIISDEGKTCCFYREDRFFFFSLYPRDVRARYKSTTRVRRSAPRRDAKTSTRPVSTRVFRNERRTQAYNN